MPKELKFKHALLPSGWADGVAISVDECGDIVSVVSGVDSKATGILIPGLANLHSHAHQRAMAGLAERAGATKDSFWTWRSIMYQFLDVMQPHHLHAIASQLYLELLSSGYTRVAEFQYLHHQPTGRHYDNIAEMSLQTLNAAQEVGIGLTSLPVHYQYGGFGEQPISAQQARFFNAPDSYLSLFSVLELACVDNVNNNIGVAGHSLRGTSKQSFTTVLDAVADGQDLPIHIHIAEQIKEVEDCVAWSGVRPVDYCLDNFSVDQAWCLVHATHMTDAETKRLARSGAVAGICPTTEANLGDGFFNAAAYLQAGGKFGIGSDSHISTSPVEELRWFEYGQRLLHQSRNQLSGGANRSTGRNLFEIAAAGGAQACGHNSGSIQIGQRADFLVLDETCPILMQRDGDAIFDSWVFSGNVNAVRDVYVGGNQVIKDGHHAQQEQINKRFADTLRELTT